MIRRVVALMLLLALGACSKVATNGAGGQNAWTIPGVLRYGETEEPDSLNLMYGNNASTDMATALIYSFFLRYDDNGNYIPDLATVVPSMANGGISADGKTITWHLRHGVVWSDGAPLTANDWLFTYHAVMNPANNVKSRYGWDTIASANAPNPYTLVVHLKTPSVAGFDIFTMGGTSYPPLPAHILAHVSDLAHADFNSAPLSSGPFIVRRWTRGDSIDFVANPRYWRGPPKLKELIWKIVPDDNTRLTLLRTHEIDVYPNVEVESVPQLTGLNGVVVTHRTIANWRHLGINTNRPFLRDLRVREAIAYGIDWKHINDTIYHGYNQLAVSDVYPGSWAAPHLPPYTYDPSHASALLQQAGWTRGSDGMLEKNGAPLRLTISATTSAKSNEDSEVVMQQALHALGIDAHIRNYPPALFFSRDGPLYHGQYDLEWSIDTNGPDPDNSGTWNSAYIPPHGANTSWLRDAIVDRTSIAAASTYDRAARRRMYQQEEERLRAVVPAVFFYWESSYYGANPDFHGYKPAAYLIDTWNAWEWSI